MKQFNRWSSRLLSAIIRPIGKGLGFLVLPILIIGQTDTSVAVGEEIIPEEVTKINKDGTEAADDDGWTMKLNLGASGSAVNSNKVVGQTDGTTLQAGILLTGSANMISGQHNWQNSLTIEENVNRSPIFERFIKSADSIELKSLYLYSYNNPSWLGHYGRGRATSSIFDGYSVRDDDTTVVRTYRDGTTDTSTVAGNTNLDLTNSFEPLLVNESIGLFASPIKQEKFTFLVRAGVGGQHIFVGDGFAETDDGDTPELELTQLQGSNSLGSDVELEVTSQLNKLVSAYALASLFYPVITTFESDLEGLDMLHTELTGGVSVKLAKWLSLDYLLKAKKLPFIINEWQVQNSMLLSAGFNLL